MKEGIFTVENDTSELFFTGLLEIEGDSDLQSYQMVCVHFMNFKQFHNLKIEAYLTPPPTSTFTNILGFVITSLDIA